MGPVHQVNVSIVFPEHTRVFLGPALAHNVRVVVWGHIQACLERRLLVSVVVVFLVRIPGLLGPAPQVNAQTVFPEHIRVS